MSRSALVCERQLRMQVRQKQWSQPISPNCLCSGGFSITSCSRRARSAGPQERSIFSACCDRQATAKWIHHMASCASCSQQLLATFEHSPHNGVLP